VDNWKFGRQCGHDRVNTHSLQRSALAHASVDPATTVAEAEKYNISDAKSAREANGIDFPWQLTYLRVLVSKQKQQCTSL